MCEDTIKDTERDDRRDEPRREVGEGPNTTFIQYEMSEVLRHSARRAFEEGFHKILTAYVQQEIEDRCGQELKDLAKLAVDQALAEIGRNETIQRLVKKNKEDEDESRKKAEEILAKLAAR